MVINQKQKTTPTPATTATTATGSSIFNPGLKDSYDFSQKALQEYFQSLNGYEPVGSLTDELDKAGSYQGYDWNNLAKTYDAPTYEALAGYTRPDLERTNYSTPSIDELQSISPVADELYDAQAAQANKKLSRSYQDTKSEVLDQIYRNKNRPEQAAALLAELGVQQAESQQEAEQNIRYQQAQDKLGIAKQEQELGLNRSTALANLGLSAEQAQADERKSAAEYLLGANQWEEAQRQYGNEQAVSAAQFKTGLQQAYDESMAAEAQNKYESAYNLAQDKTQAKLNEYETNRAGQYDYYNSILQGQQAAQNQFGQGATYFTNLNDGETKQALTSGNTTNSSLYNMPNLSSKAGGSGTAYKSTNLASRYSMPKSRTGGAYA